MRGSRLAILKYLQTHPDGLTSKEAFKHFGVTRLAAVIHELRNYHDIDTVMFEGKTQFGEYTQYARYFYRGEKDGNKGISN